jgi:lysophospholipase L1-like esterase
VVIAVCIIAGCVEKPAEEIRVACVGNSITFGSLIVNRSFYSYPSQLDRMLGDGWDVRNFGYSGATLLKNGSKPYWVQKEYDNSLEFNPHIVIIMLGTNDVLSQNWAEKQDFTGDYKEMIEAFSGLPAKPRIWIAYPVPVYPEGGTRMDKTIRTELIPLIDEVGRSMGIPVIDLYTPLSGRPELFPDRIHPNAEGARLIAEEVYSAIKDTDLVD